MLPDRCVNRFVEIAVILAVCAVLFFYGLGSFGLLGADEPRYAQIGSEMLARHDWIVPTLNGTPWLEKPPLLYWGEMAAYAVFGDHDWVARVPVSLLTSLMIFALWAFVRRRIPERALDAALIAASCIFVVGFGRGASTDMPLTACFTMGMLAWMEWFLGGRRAWLLAFYVFQALGALAKGPVSPFLAGVLIVVFAFIWNPRGEGHGSRAAEALAPRPVPRVPLVLRTLWWPGVLLFLLIAIPWYVAVQLKTGDFFRVFILEHNLERFGTNLYRHHQPFWYYLPVLLAGVLPWTAVFVAECVRTVRNFRLWRSERPLMLFVFLWCVIPVVFFSLSQSKLPGYILPAVPAAVLMIFHYLHERPYGRLPLPIIFLHALGCGAVLALVLIAPHLLLKMKPGSAAIAYSVAAGLTVFVLVTFLVYRRGVRIAPAITLVPVIVAVAFIVKAAAPVIDETQSARPLAGQIERVAPKDAPVVLYRVPRPLEFGLQYYRRGTIAIADDQPLPDRPSPYVLVTKGGTKPEYGVWNHVGHYAGQNLDVYIVTRR